MTDLSKLCVLEKYDTDIYGGIKNHKIFANETDALAYVKNESLSDNWEWNLYRVKKDGTLGKFIWSQPAASPYSQKKNQKNKPKGFKNTESFI